MPKNLDLSFPSAPPAPLRAREQHGRHGAARAGVAAVAHAYTAHGRRDAQLPAQQGRPTAAGAIGVDHTAAARNLALGERRPALPSEQSSRAGALTDWQCVEGPASVPRSLARSLTRPCASDAARDARAKLHKVLTPLFLCVCARVDALLLAPGTTVVRRARVLTVLCAAPFIYSS